MCELGEQTVQDSPLDAITVTTSGSRRVQVDEYSVVILITIVKSILVCRRALQLRWDRLVYADFMARSARARPQELTPSWPDEPSPNPIGEVARLFVLNLRAAIGERSLRAVADNCELHHATLLGILEGRTWPDLETLAKIERGLAADLWPGRIEA